MCLNLCWDAKCYAGRQRLTNVNLRFICRVAGVIAYIIVGFLVTVVGGAL